MPSKPCELATSISCRLQETPRTFLFGRTLGLESDGIEELRMPECVSIADCDEHTAEVAMVKFVSIFLPELSEGPLGVE